MGPQGSAERYSTPPPDHTRVVFAFNHVLDNLRREVFRSDKVYFTDTTLNDSDRSLDAVYYELVQVIARITGQAPKDGTPALPCGLESYFWLNEFTSTTSFKGRKFRQWEGIPMRGLLSFQINFARTALRDGDREKYNLETLRRSSLGYDDIHGNNSNGMWGVYKEARKEQRAWSIHTNHLLDSQLPETNIDHQRQDWWKAGADIDGQRELIVPPYFSIR